MPGEHKAALNPTLDCATSLRPMLGCGAGLRPAQGCGTVLHPAQGSGTGCPMLGCRCGLAPHAGQRHGVAFCGKVREVLGAFGDRNAVVCQRGSPFAHDGFTGVRRTMTFRSAHGLRFRALSLFHVCGMDFERSISLRPQPYGLALPKQYKRTCVRFTVLRTIAHASLILPGVAW